MNGSKHEKELYCPKQQAVQVTVPSMKFFVLEALWKQIEHTEQFDKNNLQYRVMIRQPDFVTPDVLEAAIVNVSKKKSLPRFKDVRLESIEDGECVQILHVGPYDDEPESFMKVDEFCAAHITTC